ncbi:hypothetical protein POL68_11705 [Stigmatella sp. ncwal1]|uniref:CARDB domain-containing protein n=1 Tax=Stigmatella ashevillensis TaxID=2995309 RepID=A0ABT5D637_9BACT|nr:hypothetical protein [Stigmatella ashevillena]MDC0709129.1 hypothetical protein [Stigmatella ashevillena]
MKLNRMLWLVAFTLIQLPFEARAASQSGDTEYCATPYPFWWRYDGPRVDVAVKDWLIQPSGESFRISFTLVNEGTATFEGGMAFVLSHAAVDPRGYADPSSLAPPSNARSLLGAESLVQGQLPTLRPGERAVLTAEARAIAREANHILTLSFYDGAQSQGEPVRVPWFWVRLLSPRATPGTLVIQDSRVEPTDSRREGYSARRVQIAIKNVGRTAVEAGTPIRVIHGHSGSAGGYWGPDDIIDPNDPGNPYASFFREEVYSARLERALNPGEILELESNVSVPEGAVGLQQMTVAVGN